MEATDIQSFVQNIEQTHSQRIRDQEEAQTYYDDTFTVKIPAPFHIVRTGKAADMVDNMVAHIETCNPQVFREPKNGSEKARDSAQKVARMLNSWAKELTPEIVESVWNAVLYGEAEFMVEFNGEAYKKDGKDYKHIPGSLPVLVTAPSPLSVFCYPYDALLPTRVVRKFKIDGTLANELFPSVPLDSGSKEVEYISYYDSKERYIEVNKVQVGNTVNPLGFTPFVHYYAGFGKRSPSGKPESMAVGLLKKYRGTLVEQCEMVSRIDSVISLYANPILQIEKTDPDADEQDGEELKKATIGPGSVVVTGFGWKQTLYTPDVATAQLFAHLSQIESRLNLASPPIMSGVASSSRVSGRQEDVEYEHISKKFQKLVSNLERALEEVFGMCLRILYEMPQALPLTIRGEVVEKGKRVVKEETITKEDIDGYYDCSVKLNPDEAVENDRNFMKYRMLVNEGRISWKRFLMEGCGMTEWEADDTIAEALAEQAVRDDPMMRAARTNEALKMQGMERFIQETEQSQMLQQKFSDELANYQPQQGRVRPSEAQNPAAIDTLRQILSSQQSTIRRSPNGEMAG